MPRWREGRLIGGGPRRRAAVMGFPKKVGHATVCMHVDASHHPTMESHHQKLNVEKTTRPFVGH